MLQRLANKRWSKSEIRMAQPFARLAAVLMTEKLRLNKFAEALAITKAELKISQLLRSKSEDDSASSSPLLRWVEIVAETLGFAGSRLFLVDADGYLTNQTSGERIAPNGNDPTSTAFRRLQCSIFEKDYLAQFKNDVKQPTDFDHDSIFNLIMPLRPDANVNLAVPLRWVDDFEGPCLGVAWFWDLDPRERPFLHQHLNIVEWFVRHLPLLNGSPSASSGMQGGTARND